MATDQFPWVQVVSSLGFPIVVVLMIIKGWLVPGFIYQRIVDDNDRLSKVVEDKVIPLVTQSKEVLSEALDVAPLLRDFRGDLAETHKGLRQHRVESEKALKEALDRLDDYARALRRARME